MAGAQASSQAARAVHAALMAPHTALPLSAKQCQISAGTLSSLDDRSACLTQGTNAFLSLKGRASPSEACFRIRAGDYQ